MAHYSYAQLEGLWVRAGGPAKLAPLMAAIAMAESSGDSNAHNPSGATGLWQILGNPFPGNAFDPLTNARMAVAKWKSQGLGAWVTFTSGAYKKFLQGGVAPSGSASATVPGRTPPPGGAGGGGLLGVPGDVVSFFSGAATAIDWLLLPSHWVRIFCFLAGAWGVLTGLWLLSHAGGSL